MASSIEELRAAHEEAQRNLEDAKALQRAVAGSAERGRRSAATAAVNRAQQAVVNAKAALDAAERAEQIERYDANLFEAKMRALHRKLADNKLALDAAEDDDERARLLEEQHQHNREIDELREVYNDVGVAAGHEVFSTEKEDALKKEVLGAAKKAAGLTVGGKAAAALGATGAALGAVGRGYKTADRHFQNAQKAVGNTYNSLNNSFMAAQDAVLNHPYHLWVLALVAILLHAYDATTGFSRASGNATLMFTAYALFATWVIFVYKKTDFSQESLRYLGVSLFAWALPLILKIPFIRDSAYVVVALAILPIWFLFLAFESENKALHFLARLLVIGFAILLVIIAVSMVTVPDIGTRGVNLGGPFTRFWNDVKDAWARIKERFTSSGFFSVKAWRQRINTTFNPYAQFYAGQVEQTQEQPQGVFLTNLQSVYPTNYNGTPIVLTARLEAKTWLDTPVLVTPSCRLSRPGTGGWYGKPSPDGPIEVNKQLTSDILCRFESDTITPGTYTGFIGAAFGFETWSYITDTFVSRQLIEQYLRQGKDVNTELQIEPTTHAVYTNGPVELGVSATEQPIAVDPDAKDGRFVQQRFGFTLASRWSQGKLGEVHSVDVLVPDPFELNDCEPTFAGKTVEDGYTRYVFDREVLVGSRDYRTVTCQLVLPDRPAAEKVLAYGDKTPATFVVIARYQYELEQQLPVRVVA